MSGEGYTPTSGDSAAQHDENIFINAIYDVISGRAGADALATAIDMAKEELKKIRYDFDITLSHLHPSIQEACGEITREINRYFGEYEWLFEDTSSYFNTKDKAILKKSAESAVQISSSLNELFFEFRQKVLLTLGPTEVPGINYLIDTINGILRGDDSLEELLGQLAEMEHEVASQTLESLNPHDPFREILLMYIEIIEKIGIYLKKKDKNFLGALSFELEEAGNIMAQGDPDRQIEELSAGPTSSPQANIVFNTATELKYGEADVEFFADQLVSFYNLLQGIKREYAQIKKGGFESEELANEAQNVEKNIIALEEAISRYYEYLKTAEIKFIDSAGEQLRKAVEALEKSMSKFETVISKNTRISCMKCGYMNFSSDRFCENCKAAMPFYSVSQADTSENEDGFYMTENVHRLFDAAVKTAEGKMGKEEFNKILSWMESLLEQAYKATAEMASPEPEKEESEAGTEQNTSVEYDEEDASVYYMQGLIDFEKGLEFMRSFADDGSQDAMQSGMDVIIEGMKKLQKVLELTNTKS